MKLSRAIQEFVHDTRMRTGSNETARAYDGDLKALIPFARYDSVMMFNEDLLNSAFLAMSQRGLGMNSLYRKASCYRQFAQWAMLKKYILHDPTRDPRFKFKMRRGIPRPLEPAEMERIWALPLVGAENVIRALLYYTGLRNTPVCNLLHDSVSFAPLTFTTKKGEVVSVPGTIRSVNKGQRELVTPMAPELAPILADWIARNPGKPYDRLVRYPNGRPYNMFGLCRMVNRWSRAAEVAKLTPHRFRHTYATDLLRDGVDLEVVQKLLGHASITTTQIYTKIGDASLVAAMMGRSRSR